MRITGKSLMDNYLANMQTNLGAMSKYQNQLATGKEVRKPSDDPFKVVKAIGLEGVLAKNAQYKKNISDAQGWMDMTDTATQEVLDILNRFKGQTTQAGSAMSSKESLTSIVAEMSQNIERLAQVGNTTYEGRYIFGGYATDVPPFTVNTEDKLLEQNPDVLKDDANGAIIREIAPAVEFPINVTATKLMGGFDYASTDENGDPITKTHDTIGVTLQKIYNTIKPTEDGIPATPNFLDSDHAGENATYQEQLDYAMKELDRHFTNVTGILAEVGAKANRLESAYNRNSDQTLSTTEILSMTEDVDYVEKITQYMSMENTYNAALASGGKILQLSLINYLK